MMMMIMMMIMIMMIMIMMIMMMMMMMITSMLSPSYRSLGDAFLPQDPHCPPNPGTYCLHYCYCTI